MQQEKQVSSLKLDLLTTKQAAIGALLMISSVVLAVIGPFNTFGMGRFWWRLLYWGGLVLSSVVLASFVQIWVSRLLRTSFLAREAVIVTLFSVLFTPVVILWTDLILVDARGQVPGIYLMFLYVLAICIGISAFRHAGPELMGAMTPVAEVAPVKSTPPRLVRRLPQDFSGYVLRVSGDGHYVNVSTTQGVFDVRIRLSDAIDEMDQQDGFCVHRSHWVTRDAIIGNDTVRGRSVLLLNNGDTVPVGAKYRDQLEEAGIL